MEIEVRVNGKEERLQQCTIAALVASKEAVRLGANYIGVGPIFATKTKDDVCDPFGFDYLDWVLDNISLPFVAIGGIKDHNIDQIVARGVKTTCLVTEIVGSKDIVQKNC